MAGERTDYDLEGVVVNQISKDIQVDAGLRKPWVTLNVATRRPVVGEDGQVRLIAFERSLDGKDQLDLAMGARVVLKLRGSFVEKIANVLADGQVVIPPLPARLRRRVS